MKRFLIFIISLVCFFLPGSLSAQEKPDVTIGDVSYSSGFVKVKYCNKGIGTSDKTVTLTVKGYQLREQNSPPLQIPEPNVCFDTYGVKVEQFGLLFNNGKEVLLTAEIDSNHSIDESDELNNMSSKSIVLWEPGSPLITGSAASGVLASDAKVTWQTDIPSTSECRIFTKAGSVITEYNCDFFIEDKQYGRLFSTSHSLELSKLREGTSYSLYIRSVASDGKVSEKGPIDFTTLMSSGIERIQNVRVTDVNHDTAHISWNTDISAFTGCLYYGFGDRIGTDRFEISCPPETREAKRNHQIGLGLLDHDTKYYFYLVSRKDVEKPLTEVYSFRTKSFVPKIDRTLIKRLLGSVLVQVEDRGRIWYVNPKDGLRYELLNYDTFVTVRKFALGITSDNLVKIPPVSESVPRALDSDSDGYTDAQEFKNGYDPYNAKPVKFTLDNRLQNRMKGVFVLQVDAKKDPLWYVDGKGERYNIRKDNLKTFFKKYALGITNVNLMKIPVGGR